MQLYDLPIVWMPWAEAGLAGLLLLICALQPHALAGSIQVVSSSIQRRYNSGRSMPLVWILRAVFEFSTITLSILMVIRGLQSRPLQPTGMEAGIGAGVVLGVMLMKSIVDKWVQVTFRYSMNEHTYYTFRGDLWLIASVALLGILVVSTWLNSTALWIAPCGITGLYYAILWWKIMQVVGWSGKHIMVVLLYMLHAEVLPLAAAGVCIHTLLK